MILDVRLQVLLPVRFCSKYVFEKCLRIHDFEKNLDDSELVSYNAYGMPCETLSAIGLLSPLTLLHSAMLMNLNELLFTTRS
jgi:hypothetical protein